jgi:hypothetical protein
MFSNWFRSRSTVRKQPAPSSPRRVFRPAVEALEDRLTLDGTVTGSFLNGTWTLTGDTANNRIVINSTGTPGAFTVANDPTEFVATMVTGVTAPTGVKRIVIIFGEGNDEVQFNTNATPITLKRGLTINGGNGDNRVFATDLKIRGNLAITNGVGADGHAFTNLKVVATATPGTGKVTINNGDGGSSTTIMRDAAGFNSIAKRLSVTNGSGGFNVVQVFDTNVGGSIINNNGFGDGAFQLWNNFNSSTRAVIGGSVVVSFANGGETSIFDAVVKGNVSNNNGIGTGETVIDGRNTTLPVVIKGSLTITGRGLNDQVLVGTVDERRGMRVGKNVKIMLSTQAKIRLHQTAISGGLTIDTAGTPDTLEFVNLFVTGPTTIT